MALVFDEGEALEGDDVLVGCPFEFVMTLLVEDVREAEKVVEVMEVEVDVGGFDVSGVSVEQRMIS